MPNEKAISLHASATETAAGTGSPIDVEVRTYTEIALDVTDISPTCQLVPSIESSQTLSAWSTYGHFPTITKAGYYTLIIPDGLRYLRARWTFNGTSHSATFAITGISHQLYTTPKDLEAAGMSKNLRASKSVLELATACLIASSEAEGYLANSNALPITSLDSATRMHIARLAVFETARLSGIVGTSDRASGAFEIGRSDALKWLSGISSGKVRPPGLIDATPNVTEAGGAGSGDLFVISSPSRRW